MHLRSGDQAPDFRVQLPEGPTVSLADHQGHGLLLIFVRHLACLPCQQHLIEVRESLSSIAEHGAEVLVVSFDSVERLDAYRAYLKLNYPVASDPARSAYGAYGLTRAPLLRVWHPKTLWRYVRLLREGRSLQRPKKGDDLAQLGGDFVVDARGEILFAYYCRRPDDRPAIDAILAAVARCSR